MKADLIIILYSPEESVRKGGIQEVLGARKTGHLYRAMLFDTIAMCLSVAGAEYALLACSTESVKNMREMLDLFDHEEKSQLIKRRLSDLKLIDTGNSPTARRVGYALNWGFNKGFRRVALVRSCCPMLTPAIIKVSFLLLRKHKAVIGPTFGGDFYLFGLSTMLPGIADILGESEKKYVDIIGSLSRHNADLQELELSYEVRSPIELNQLVSDIECLRKIGDNRTALHTEKFLRSLDRLP